MYKEKISRYIDAHKKEMLEDIEELCRINSVKGSLTPPVKAGHLMYL